MRRLTFDDLRRSTLRRQFPVITGRGPAAVLELFDRIGPVQSQVPRAPFLAAASRLPGVRYETVNSLLAQHELVKTSNLRGTVHTSPASWFDGLDAVARTTRSAALAKAYGLTALTPAEVTTEVERFCADRWRSREEIVAHVRAWLPDRDPAAAPTFGETWIDSFVWGHSGLLRRPRDGAWERRTDVYRRTARAVLPGVREVEFAEALPSLVARHLAGYGPVLREDLIFFFGVSITAIKAALAALGDRVVRLPGPDRDDYLDLAEPPRDGLEDPGLRLLPEFDGLLLGFQGRNRTRFVDGQQLGHIWAKVNGLFAPVVLHQGRIVATWKTVGAGRRVRLEVRMLEPHPALPENQLRGPVADTEAALNLTVTEVVVRAAHPIGVEK